MIETVSQVLAKAVGFALPWVARWYFKAATIEAKIDIQLPDDRDGVTFYGLDIPFGDVYLSVVNRSAFAVTLTGLSVNLTYGVPVGKWESMQKIAVPPSEKAITHTQVYFTDAQARHLRANQGKLDEQARLYVTAYFTSPIHPLSVSRQVNIRKPNFTAFTAPSSTP